MVDITTFHVHPVSYLEKSTISFIWGVYRSGSAFALHVKGPGFDPRHLQWGILFSSFFSNFNILICIYSSFVRLWSKKEDRKDVIAMDDDVAMAVHFTAWILAFKRHFWQEPHCMLEMKKKCCCCLLQLCLTKQDLGKESLHHSCCISSSPHFCRCVCGLFCSVHKRSSKLFCSSTEDCCLLLLLIQVAMY